MDSYLDVDLGGRRLRTLAAPDAPFVAEATSGESARSLWGARPAGPYSIPDARAALADWDLAEHRQTSYGVFDQDRLLAAVGLMLDDQGGAELAYWVRPEDRRRGIAFQALTAVTRWASGQPDLAQLWLEINPVNLASRRLADKAGYSLEGRLRDHCRSWVSEDPDRDRWHDCLIWVHPAAGAGAQS